MADQWVILELSPKAENEDPNMVRRSIQHVIRGADVFIPALVTERGDDRVIQYLVEGYAFIRRTHEDRAYFKLEGTRFVQTIITQPSTVNGAKAQRQIACVTDRDIERMRKQIRAETDQGISVGDLVVITSGPYRQIKAVVIEDLPELDSVQVEVKLRSKESLVTLPRSFLRLAQKAERPAYLDKIEKLADWISLAQAFTQWSGDGLGSLSGKGRDYLQFSSWLEKGTPLQKFIQAFGRYLDISSLSEKGTYLAKVQGWLDRGQPRDRFIWAFRQPLELAPLVEQSKKAISVSLWLDRGNYLTEFVNLYYNTSPLPPLESKYLEWSWLQDATDRLRQVDRDVDAIGRVLAVEAGETAMQNIIIDGFNLAIRCLSAPGLDSLCDSKGRHTGVIVGFLRSLGSLVKRFPGATVYVCWDCSSQRRRQMFAGYKANRGEHSTSKDQVAWVRETLPLLGVYQAWQEAEEADDVIASLVRGNLKGQKNIIVTTDRDLLQLVTETDSVLVPAVGGRKELLFDPSAVEAEYGVVPEKMPSLRAFLGDTSDNIPGVPRIPSKVVAQLVQMYGNITRIYDSNLSGLSKLQAQKLRTAEQQVKLNLRLMQLIIDLPFVLQDPNLDENAARLRLQDVEVQPDPILAAFNRAAGSEVRRATDDKRVCDSG